ncbi:MAG: SDR family oxidoreductase [Pseudanabaenaceae cyanobacterium SKYGB_i_bin29]|nr:SDR family oxidoreductase [Pseudanabaenaceae cyanobacterium SKYG29]MDW8421422.1 SDR family oxidoreductase [Pseudanabaenaceae cyanobacterium SKYGB_i_bin29]
MPTVLITGAGAGIGRATALYFQQQGWNVVAGVRRLEAGGALQSLEHLLCLQLDVNEQATIDAAVQQTFEHFGSLDVLVNNAGFGTFGAFEYATEEQILKQFQTNVFGLMRMTRSVLPHFRARRQGMIINISSVAGRLAFPLYSLYHATKFAIEGFSESLQYELAPFNIKVKLIEPGAIKTDFFDRSQVILQSPHQDDYESYQTKVWEKLKAVAASAPPPAIVAKVIWQAAHDKSDRLRYSVGDQVPLLLLVNRLLPHTWLQSIIKKTLT